MPLTFSLLHSRIPFLFSNAIALHIALTSPNGPPSQSEKDAAKYDRGEQIYANIQTWLPLYNTLLIATVTLAESAAILRAIAPDSALATLLPAWIPALHSKPTPLFLLGWAVATAGAALRVACYRAMGRMFTFELSIRKDHALVTRGPYAWVRHPSYTGFLMFMGGVWLCQLCPGALVGGWIGGLGLGTRKVLGTMAAVVAVMDVMATVKRMDKEDNMLKGEFGQTWEEWAKKVPARLVPFVF
ncbi:hypothetical protein HWV62_13675 [Athelia sp. TMB]|nr:hypothetical protein HWV62_13675 [Athelia sp. TMB]